MTATQAPTPGPLSAGQEETIAFNLCAVHGFEPDFVKTQRDFALAVIREYEASKPRLAPTAPVEASGSEREADAWKWLGQLYPNDAPSDLAYDANEMVDAFLAGSGRSDRMAKALERIADEQQYRSGYCQTDITVEPALTAEEAQTVAREALAQQTAPRPQPSGETRWTDEELRSAIKATEYKYFGDYEFSEEQHAAVDVLVLSLIHI